MRVCRTCPGARSSPSSWDCTCATSTPGTISRASSTATLSVEFLNGRRGRRHGGARWTHGRACASFIPSSATLEREFALRHYAHDSRGSGDQRPPAVARLMGRRVWLWCGMRALVAALGVTSAGHDRHAIPDAATSRARLRAGVGARPCGLARCDRTGDSRAMIRGLWPGRRARRNNSQRVVVASGCRRQGGGRRRRRMRGDQHRSATTGRQPCRSKRGCQPQAQPQRNTGETNQPDAARRLPRAVARWHLRGRSSGTIEVGAEVGVEPAIKGIVHVHAYITLREADLTTQLSPGSDCRARAPCGVLLSPRQDGMPPCSRGLRMQPRSRGCCIRG